MTPHAIIHISFINFRRFYEYLNIERNGVHFIIDVMTSVEKRVKRVEHNMRFLHSLQLHTLKFLSKELIGFIFIYISTNVQKKKREYAK